MAGNARRPGAVRKTSRKGPTVGSGGQRRKGLEGRGPTPKAEDRVNHKAHRAAAARARSAGGGGSRSAAGDRPPGAGRAGRAADAGARAGRGGSGTEVIAGRNSVLEALQAGVPVSALYLASRYEVDDRVRAVLRIAQQRSLPLLETARPELDRLTGGAVHQGVAAQIPPYAYLDPRDLFELPGSPLLVALDGVTDPRNLGAVIRSVAAFGGQGVIVPQRRSAGMTAGAWKASAGTAARVPVALAANLTRTLEDARRAGFQVVGLDGTADLAVSELDGDAEALLLVLGAEDKGLSRLVRQTCDLVVGIRMASAVESLNAGVAAGIALYEVSRRRGLDRAEPALGAETEQPHS